MVGAGINGLVAANYLLRAGHQVTMIERANRVGGACVSATAEIGDVEQQYALGASTLGLMQDFVWHDTGLADRLSIRPVTDPDLVFFPDSREPVPMYADAERASKELADKWGEHGDLAAMFVDEERVIRFLQAGYREAQPPTLADARTELGDELTKLWITGSARELLDHYLTAEKTKTHFSMSVMESGPVSVTEPYSAYIIPMMGSGSVFDGDYGFVRGGIWRITEELGAINRALGADIKLGCNVLETDCLRGTIQYSDANGETALPFDHIVFATDPQTAARLTGSESLIQETGSERILGTSGKLNLMFRKPVQWRHGDSDTAFRYIYTVDTLADLDAATLAVTEGRDFSPGYYQVYCEGAAMRHMGLDEPFERLAVFFKNLAFGKRGDELPEVEAQVRSEILAHIANPEDCVWSRLLTPRDLQRTFGFPAGNIEHTMLGAGQSYADRQYSENPARRFYQFGDYETASICGSGTYPCGSVAGTPAYMCVQELLPHLSAR